MPGISAHLAPAKHCNNAHKPTRVPCWFCNLHHRLGYPAGVAASMKSSVQRPTRVPCWSCNVHHRLGFPAGPAANCCNHAHTNQLGFNVGSETCITGYTSLPSIDMHYIIRTLIPSHLFSRCFIQVLPVPAVSFCRPLTQSSMHIIPSMVGNR